MLCIMGLALLALLCCDVVCEVEGVECTCAAVMIRVVVTWVGVAVVVVVIVVVVMVVVYWVLGGDVV